MVSKSKYAMSEMQVETLAAEYATAAVEAQRVNVTYLRVLVVAVQSVIGNKRRSGRVPIAQQADVLADVSGKYYPAVLRGITTPDVAPDDGLERGESIRRSIERNRRSTFARSAKSALAQYIKAGGDVRALDAETVTRDPLLAHVRASRGVAEGGYRMERLRNAMLRLATREARDNPDTARAELAATIEALQFALDALPGPGVEAGTITNILATRPMHTRQRAPQGRAHA